MLNVSLSVCHHAGWISLTWPMSHSELTAHRQTRLWICWQAGSGWWLCWLLPDNTHTSVWCVCCEIYETISCPWCYMTCLLLAIMTCIIQYTQCVHCCLSVHSVDAVSRQFNLSFPSVWLHYWLHHWLFLYRALEAACAAYASLNLSLLHYITLQYEVADTSNLVEVFSLTLVHWKPISEQTGQGECPSGHAVIRCLVFHGKNNWRHF